ncbi:10608_t:CDS:2 [Ambispora leptoticha]|uniref:Aldehyde dehydrogenase n=1 Tax=Ambispora leptoticha TaxID=144679 RepID=A0A9N8VTE8_9GLOM|nr:10608_t:CDS:2 [Ambispora leptoticha]
MTLEYTNIEDFPEIVTDLRKTFSKNVTKSIAYRKQQLQQLYYLIEENEELIFDAVAKDFQRSRTEAWLGETALLKAEIIEFVNKLDEWAKPQIVETSIAYKFNKCYIIKEPIGTVLIIGTWNYPISLSLAPFAGAMAAGCTAICKPSEVATHSAKLIGELFPKYLDHNAYRIVQAGPEGTVKLLEQKFDHIFYTGSTAVGKKVMEAAAKNLTPVTLELGGKSPVIVANDANILISAKRIIWGKIYNCGQTCIAPDYIICERLVQTALIDSIPKVLEEFLGENIKQSKDYARIVNQRHFDRLQNMLLSTKGNILIGGDSDRDDLYIAPTVVTDVTKEDSLMQEEIFGPILPIVVVEDIDEAIEFVNNREIPLALYPFTSSKKLAKHILDNTQSGGVCVNDCILHFAIPTLPFGGKGNSGMGNYHGKKSFDTFTHERSTNETPYYVEKLLGSRYPPYTNFKIWLLQLLIHVRPNFPRNTWSDRMRRLFVKILKFIVYSAFLSYLGSPLVGRGYKYLSQY